MKAYKGFMGLYHTELQKMKNPQCLTRVGHKFLAPDYTGSEVLYGARELLITWYYTWTSRNLYDIAQPGATGPDRG